jgi:hypothetical protein
MQEGGIQRSPSGTEIPAAALSTPTQCPFYRSDNMPMIETDVEKLVLSLIREKVAHFRNQAKI